MNSTRWQRRSLFFWRHITKAFLGVSPAPQLGRSKNFKRPIPCFSKTETSGPSTNTAKGSWTGSPRIFVIEVEKNFDLRPGDKEKLIEAAKFLGKKTFTDIYYDTEDFQLTTKDFWLRQRDGNWELKMPLNGTAANRDTDQYRELESEKEIALALELPGKSPLQKEIQDMGAKPFAAILTNRERYQKGNFHLDFDEMDFGFRTFEAELMVENESEIPAAEQKIIDFAREYGIDSAPGAGKVIEFLKLRHPAHYRALQKAGVIREHV